jgi:hypothetical protein
MAEPCFIKKDSTPPVCGVHNAPLIRKLLPNELISVGFKNITFLACPVSGLAVDDPAMTLGTPPKK